MPKRSPPSPRPIGGPPAKVPKPDSPSRDGSDVSTPTQVSYRGNSECLSHDMPPPEQRGAERAVGREVAREGDAATATRNGMTPESCVREGSGGNEQQGYDSYDPQHTSTDRSGRDKVDIDLYRKHFSGYRENRAHLSSNPYIESDERLKGGEHRHDFPGEKQGGTDTYERRDFPSLAYSAPATAQGTALSQYGSQPPAMLGNTRSTAGGQPVGRAYGPWESQEDETNGDRHGQWTERVQELKKYADSRGASLSSMFPDRDPATFHSDAASFKRQHKSKEENEVKHREATMALYSYPRVQNAQQFFAQVPEGRKEELERVKRDLKDMEEQLQNATKERMDEVSAAKDTGPSNRRSTPTQRRD